MNAGNEKPVFSALVRALHVSESSEKLLFTTKESTHSLSVSERTLEAWRKERRPPWFKLTGIGRGVRYRLDGLKQWIDEQTGAP